MNIFVHNCVLSSQNRQFELGRVSQTSHHCLLGSETMRWMMLVAEVGPLSKTASWKVIFSFTTPTIPASKQMR